MYTSKLFYNRNNLNHDSKSLKVSALSILRKDFNLALKSLEVPASTTCCSRLFHSCFGLIPGGVRHEI